MSVRNNRLSKHCDYNYDHALECQRYPEKCPIKCSEEDIERRFLQRHLEEDCPLQQIECEFSFSGCATKLERRKTGKMNILVK